MSDKYKGMTVNERLATHGTINDFYISVDKKDVEKVKEFLKEIELNDLSIKDILESLGLV